MSTHSKPLLIAAIPMLCLLGSIPVCYATRYKTEAAKAKSVSSPYPAKLRLYQKLADLTSKANQNGGEVTVSQKELKALARDFREASQ